jgi:hypothetical protein
LLAKYFKKESKPMAAESDEYLLRVGGVANDDDSVSFVLCNRGDKALDASIRLECPTWRPLRKFSYEAGNVPRNPFADLPKWEEEAAPEENRLLVKVPARSVQLFTTDYRAHVPESVGEPVIGPDGTLSWNPSKDEHHCYTEARKELHFSSRLDVAHKRKLGKKHNRCFRL